MTDALSDRQRHVVDRVLREEGARREHLVVHLSGAHAYGFASQDSDLDLKAIHIEPPETFLGMGKLRASASRAEVIDGVEVDYTSNEVLVAARGLLQGDGNVLERVLSAAPLAAHARLPELRELARRNLSRRYYHHYRGFAESQRRLLERSPSVKKALYVLRTTLTGAHLLATGECVPDLTALAAEHGFPEAAALVALKREREAAPLEPGAAAGLPRLIERAFEHLDAALARSPLAEEPAARAALERWIIDVRVERLSRR